MKWGIGYPLSAIREAISSFFGWTAVVGLIMAVGIFLGLWIGEKRLPAPLDVISIAVALPLVWLLCPWMLAAYGLTGLAWWLPMRFESVRLQIGAAVGLFFTWVFAIATLMRALEAIRF